MIRMTTSEGRQNSRRIVGDMETGNFYRSYSCDSIDNNAWKSGVHAKNQYEISSIQHQTRGSKGLQSNMQYDNDFQRDRQQSSDVSSDSVKDDDEDHGHRGSSKSLASTAVSVVSYILSSFFIYKPHCQKDNRSHHALNDIRVTNTTNVNAPTRFVSDTQYNTNNVNVTTNYDRNMRCSNSNVKFSYRPIHVKDRVPIQVLHEEWFPVRYQDEFYDDLVLGRFNNSTEPLFTIIAEPVSPSSYLQTSCDHTSMQSKSLTANTKEDTPVIAACLVGSFLQFDQVSSSTRQLLVPHSERYSCLFYIMTLGTQERYRNYGLGTSLIHQCLQYAEHDRSCGVVYLHVIISNIPAIKFYEKLGFVRVVEIPDYYTIDERQYNCYLYAKFLNGNTGLETEHFFFKNVLLSLWKTVAQVIHPVQYLLRRPTPTMTGMITDSDVPIDNDEPFG